MAKKFDYEFDFEWVKGQYHYQSGGKMEDLTTPAARAGWCQEKFDHTKKTSKAEFN